MRCNEGMEGTGLDWSKGWDADKPDASADAASKPGRGKPIAR
jgi:hypothetical protein